MAQDWPGLIAEMNPQLAAFRGLQPDVMKAFAQMAQAATTTNALDTKTKELIALGISVAVRCDPCVAYHAKAAVKSGASEAEVAEAFHPVLSSPRMQSCRREEELVCPAFHPCQGK